MRALIVGAGAVGQVYGLHLQRGGAEVGFFVKERQAAQARGGFTLHAHRKGGRTETLRLEAPVVVTRAAELAAAPWDAVWLCVSATALRGPWLDELLAAVPNATIVSLTPGLEDREYLLQRVPPERLVSGVITLVSYQAPLPVGSPAVASPAVALSPGVAFWFPPLSASPFDGPRARVQPIVETLRRGGCPAKQRPRAWEGAARASAVMMPVLVALEAEDWSFARLRKSPHLRTAAAAAREAMGLVAAHQGRRAPWLRLLVRPLGLRMLLRLAPRLMPFDFEAYLAYHFTKVGDQTRFLVRSYVERGRALGCPTAALEALERLLPQVRP